MADVLDLHRPKAISIRSITSFAGSANTKEAYQELCKDLYEIGVTAEVIGQKKREILNTFKSQSTATSGQVDDSKNITSPSQSPAVSNLSGVKNSYWWEYTNQFSAKWELA